jgi:aspartate aminotransferase
MHVLSKQVTGYMEKSSWIRRMFEAGIELKKKYGADAVCDFSLGNPDLPPPPEVGVALREIAEDVCRPFGLGYMPNFGYPFVRESLAGEITREQGVPVSAGDLVITCGAAGAINALYRAIIDPGDEVICPSPYFVEYGFYVENHGGVLKPVATNPQDFSLDLEAMDRAITERTRAVLINSPNNPTGRVYTLDELTGLTDMLKRRSAGRERPIFLIADEPYRFLAYDGVAVPSLLPLYPHTVVVSSFSKNLSLAGARVGYALINPDMPGKAELHDGVVLANRILGFVNAPALAQLLVHKAAGAQVDVGRYKARRDAMAAVLTEAGYSFYMPRGAFYFFPQAPGGDDVRFVNLLLEEKVLGVPGSGFGMPGYFRLTFCVAQEVINRSREGFARAMAKASA